MNDALSEMPGKIVPSGELVPTDELPDEPLEIVFAEDVKPMLEAKPIVEEAPPENAANSEQSAREGGRTEG